jgi:hypothetical protein
MKAYESEKNQGTIQKGDKHGNTSKIYVNAK